MQNLSRRSFLQTAGAAMIVSTNRSFAASQRTRVFVGSGTADGILAYDWDSKTGELTSAGVAAHVSTVDWLAYSAGNKYLFAACEVDSFNGKPTGEVASFAVNG